VTPPRFAALVAVHLFLLRAGEVLLLRRFNTGYEDGNFSVPAGHLDGGEEYRDAMIREAREELGIAIALADLAPAGVIHRRADDERIDFFFSASRWTGEVVNREPDKCDELRWYPLDGLPPNTVPYVRRALDNFRRGEAFDSFGWQES
jgi:ADP-ribose pyrophosphatase YjhB (NUDIX family)